MNTKAFPIGVGLAVVVFNSQREVLLGLRHGSHASGYWAFPGGEVDEGETPIECAIRELLEETGLKLKNPRAFPWWSYEEFEMRRDVTVYVTGEVEGEPVCKEPGKCLEWRWCPVNNLPSPLFPGIEEMVKHLLTS